jgi:8-oxo-dGTP pyrophosphatase MutT (NUDIX family)
VTKNAIPAATLIVMRERAGGPPDLLMVERTQAMAFAGGAMVFPGGRIDEADAALAEGKSGEDSAARIAAIRETLEETAVAVGLEPDPTPQLGAELQRELHSGTLLSSLLDRHGLRVSFDALTPFARWKPAFHQARIFDTLFFLAEAPPGDWRPIAQEAECESVEWLSARAVLDRIGRGEASAIFPTLRNLERLAGFGSIVEARADAAAHPIETITPWIAEQNGKAFLCIPEGLGYPVTREPLDQVKRGAGAAAFPDA